jgi:hypothetical protein
MGSILFTVRTDAFPVVLTVWAIMNVSHAVFLNIGAEEKCP